MAISLFDPNEIAGKKITKNRGFIADPCKLCGMYKKCLNPKIKPTGKGKKGILIVGEAPGKDEDETGFNFVGKCGDFLSKAFNSFDIDMDEDCLRTNVLQCRPQKNEFDPSKVEYCYSRLEQQIKEFDPKLIICFGRHAVSRIIEDDIVPGLSGQKGNFGLIRGDVYPSQKYNCWVACLYHPSFILRNEDELIDFFYDDIEKALDFLDMDFYPSLFSYGKNTYLSDKNKIIEELICYTDIYDLTCFDYETNGISPYVDNPIIYLVGLSRNQSQSEGHVFRLDKADDRVIEYFRKFLVSRTPKVAQNMKFEHNWSRVMYDVEVNNWTNDPMISKHILDQRNSKHSHGKKSLAFQLFETTGDTYKDTVNRKNIEEELETNFDNLITYSSLDARAPLVIIKHHMQSIDAFDQNECHDFLIKGNEALAELEYNGVLIDKEFYIQYAVKVENSIEESRETIFSFPEVKKMKKFNINSDDDLRTLWFDKLGFDPISQTAGGQGQVNKEFFEDISKYDDEFGDLASSFIEYSEYATLQNNFIKQIVKYVDSNWFLHPTYNLWIARTFRSSCDSPNLQNPPKRNKTQKEFRKNFIPYFDNFIEADYKAAEVVIQAVLANDEVLLDQLWNNYDMHRYWASKLYKVSEDEITKEQRQNAKNNFVFPKFYGSWYKSIARDLSLDENHVKSVEGEFDNLYYGVTNWQEEKVDFYNRYGYLKTALGFRRYGPLSRNQIINTDIQATAFHCLLDSLIHIIPEMKKRKMESCLCLQVHDSVVADTVEDEEEELLELINEKSTKKPYWKWLDDAPLKVEFEKGKNWMELEEIK